MGYTTEFIGKFTFNKEPSKDLVEYINRFADTRHVKRDVEETKKIFPDWERRSWKGKPGAFAEFFLMPDDEVVIEREDYLDMTGYKKRNGILDNDNPPETQPGLWCHWIINKRGELVWSGAEKFYKYVEWLEYLIKNFFEPEGLVLSGRCFYAGERMSDWGYICVKNNSVEKIPSDIDVTEHEDMICVRMPEVIKEELKKIVSYGHGIRLEQALQRFMVWIADKPENFKIWYRNARRGNDYYENKNRFIKAVVNEIKNQDGDSAVQYGISIGFQIFCECFGEEDLLRKMDKMCLDDL